MRGHRKVVAWIILSCLTVMSPAKPAQSAPLDPRDFASLGSLIVGPGEYLYVYHSRLDVIAEGDYPTDAPLRSYTGIYHQGIHVFTFDVISVDSPMLTIDLNSLGVGLSNPLALLSKSSLTLGSAASLMLSAPGTDSHMPPLGVGGGNGGYYDPSSGGGSGGSGSSALGLVSAGDGGRGGFYSHGGGGGGALELGAVGDLSISGSILANGAAAESTYSGTAGDGGGGGILLHGNHVNLSGASIQAVGGKGGFDYSDPENQSGWGGSGGEIYIIHGPGGYLGGSYSVSGGAGGYPGVPSGSSGTITIVQVVPEPSSGWLLGLGIMGWI